MTWFELVDPQENLMNEWTLLRALALTALVVLPVLAYLRGITRRVLLQLCGSEDGAEFWLRAADVLALAGSLILVLGFGLLTPERGWVEQARVVMLLSLGAVFVTVLVVASTVWRNVPRDEAGALRPLARPVPQAAVQEGP
jgi:hypothetical protein